VRGPARIEIRDERHECSSDEEPRGEQGPDPWIASIGRRLERYGRDHLPFAVLLLELVGVERLRHAELPGEMARLTGLVEGALASELRPADSLMRESPGRYWLLAPETDTVSAKGLAIRLAEGVRRAASHRGTPMELAAGIAVCPQDGRQTAALVARADIALYAAQASGRSVGPADEQS
jgi:GGDEF domain-containing protein